MTDPRKQVILVNHEVPPSLKNIGAETQAKALTQTVALEVFSQQSASKKVSASVRNVGAHLDASVQTGGTQVALKAFPGPVSYDQYDGPYVIEPTMDEQIFNTKQKLMKDDMTVRKIRVTYTSNLSGGNTVYIGAQGI